MSATKYPPMTHPRLQPLPLAALVPPTPLFAIPPTTPIAEALRLLVEQQREAILVMDGRTVVGCFSEHAYAHSDLSATDPVSASLEFCPPAADARQSVADCLERMDVEHWRHIPVQASGSIVALLSIEDLLRALIAHQQRIYREYQLDLRILFLRGTYSC